MYVFVRTPFGVYLSVYTFWSIRLLTFHITSTMAHSTWPKCMAYTHPIQFTIHHVLKVFFTLTLYSLLL